MTDEKDKNVPPVADGERGPLCGQRLGEQRLVREILVDDVAKELHISKDKVEALERNDFELLGAPVFARGYIRKYARLVGLAEADLLAEYEELASEISTEPVLKARPRPRREMSPGPWIAVIVVVIIAATALWWFTERPYGDATVSPAMPVEVEPQPTQQRIEESQDIDSNDRVAPLDLADDSTVQETESLDTAAGQSVDDEADPQPAITAEPPDDGQLRMLLTFSGDCWTEISDGNGRRLFFGLGSAGRTVELSGKPPFNALFGNVANVRINVNGAEYTIKDSELRGRTARLTVTGS